MAKIYALLIIKGARTFDSVPTKLKADVAQLLIDMEVEYLINEEEYLPTEE